VKAIIFWPVMVVVMILDIITKSLAVTLLAPSGVPHPVVGNGLRFALVYNPGAAFGLYLGQNSRWIFMALTFGALFVLWRLYRQTEPGDVVRTLAVTLVTAGAIGNLLDRIRSDLGVVDFIDVGMGDHRWPTFNVADMAVSIGAFLLAGVLWGEGPKAVPVVAAQPVAASTISSPDLGDST
jgi:signal peptidase II